MSLADCDWLHGAAESLLTVTNLLVVLGFRRALDDVDGTPKSPSIATTADGGDSSGTSGTGSGSGDAFSWSLPAPTDAATHTAHKVAAAAAAASAAFGLLLPMAALGGAAGFGALPALADTATLAAATATATAAASATATAAVDAASSSSSSLLAAAASEASAASETLVGGSLGVHSGFLFGLGDLPSFLSPNRLLGGDIAAPEPVNALTIPTWIIHISSLIEWLVAMGLIWKYADATSAAAAAASGDGGAGTDSSSDASDDVAMRWKGITWGMLPLHTSGICACTYHVLYNAPTVEFLIALQVSEWVGG